MVLVREDAAVVDLITRSMGWSFQQKKSDMLEIKFWYVACPTREDFNRTDIDLNWLNFSDYNQSLLNYPYNCNSLTAVFCYQSLLDEFQYN